MFKDGISQQKLRIDIAFLKGIRSRHFVVLYIRLYLYCVLIDRPNHDANKQMIPKIDVEIKMALLMIRVRRSPISKQSLKKLVVRQPANPVPCCSASLKLSQRFLQISEAGPRLREVDSALNT
jgi:hypothetical protein